MNDLSDKTIWVALNYSPLPMCITLIITQTARITEKLVPSRLTWLGILRFEPGTSCSNHTMSRRDSVCHSFPYTTDSLVTRETTKEIGSSSVVRCTSAIGVRIQIGKKTWCV